MSNKNKGKDESTTDVVEAVAVAPVAKVNPLLKSVTSPAGTKKSGVPYSIEEIAAAKTACLAKIDELGGVPMKDEDGKSVINRYLFATCIKAACEAAGLTQKRQYASWAYLGKKVITELIVEAKKEEAKAKVAAAAPASSAVAG